MESVTIKDINQLQVIEKPGQVFEKVLTAVQIILKEKQGWQNARQLMKHRGGKTHFFLEKLRAFDKDSISQEQMDKLEIITSQTQDEFNPEVIATKSRAVGALAEWVLSLLEYHRVLKLVQEKKKQIEEIQKKMIQDEEEVQN